VIILISNKIIEISSEITDKVISIRREIHKYPELGFEEFKTSAFITDYLNGLGLKVKTNIAGTGVVGILEGYRAGKTVAIRADMDALPITEQNEHEFVSQNSGIMHACGHDAHIAMALGTAEILTKMRDKINGSVKFIFQPGEEGMGGAKSMIEEGVLLEPYVDVIIATHVNPELKLGRIAVGSGSILASQSEFEITIKGKGGHAAKPQDTVDPISIGVNLINIFQTIITREKNPLSNAVLSITYFHAGSSYNIIPEYAVIKGTVRTFDSNLDKYISKRMEEMTSLTTKAMGAEYEFVYNVGYPPVINHTNVVENIIASAGKIIEKEYIIKNPEPAMMSEDFAYYVQKIPGALYILGCAKPDRDTSYNLHSSKFDIDENCLKIGMQIMAQTAIDIINEEVQ
jgi:amidohydrolase